jgi:hypothetical protein
MIGENQLKIHFDMIRKADKNLGEIPVDKIVDFRLLREVRRELSAKSSAYSTLPRSVPLCDRNI